MAPIRRVGTVRSRSARHWWQPARPAGPTGRRERRGRRCLPGRDRRGVGLGLIAAITRRRCAVRIHRQAPTSTPTLTIAATHRIPSGNRPARPPQEGNTRVCRSAIASHRNRPTEPPTLRANMAKGRNRRCCTFSDRGCVNVLSQQWNRSKMRMRQGSALFATLRGGRAR